MDQIVVCPRCRKKVVVESRDASDVCPYCGGDLRGAQGVAQPTSADMAKKIKEAESRGWKAGQRRIAWVRFIEVLVCGIIGGVIAAQSGIGIGYGVLIGIVVGPIFLFLLPFL